MSKTFLAVILVFAIGSPAFSKPEVKTAAKRPGLKTSPKQSNRKDADEKQKIRDQIKRTCGEIVNTEHLTKEVRLDIAQKMFDLTAQHFGKESPEMVWPEFTLGHELSSNRDSKNAVPHLEHAHALATKYPDNPCMRASLIEIWLFKAYLRDGKHKEAIALVAGTIDELVKTKNLEKLQDFAIMYMRSGECKEADAVIRRAAACCEADHRQLLKVLQTRIMILVRCRRFKEAIPVVEQKKELLRAKGDQIEYANTVRELGQLSDLAQRFDQSSKYYKEAIQLFRTQKRDKFEVAKLLQDYSRVQRSLGRTAEADALKKEAEDLKFGIK